MDDLLASTAAAQRLGISVSCLYQWLAASDQGELLIRGERVTIAYLQGGPSGQGRIKIAVTEVERLQDLMRVVPRHRHQRRTPVQPKSFPGITVPLGLPHS